ncbi:MAG: ATP-binding protein [Chloroflexi bacterium]|nr:ATP-binding protein [Chloroflexota bacterium]
MVLNNPEHDFSYRQEILSPFFRYIHSTESFYLTGAASMGKTRLMDYLMRPDVVHHYLDVQADKTWLVRVDMNRLVERDKEWCFYELLLSSVLFESYNHDVPEELRVQLAKLDSDVIEGQSLLKALRFLELAVNRLCQVHEIKLCFVFDEFDETYKNVSRNVFAHLRAIRDTNKSRLLYILFLRNSPEGFRVPLDNESFYELISRTYIEIGPYTKTDSFAVIQQLESRREYPLTPEKRDKVYLASGGHPGMIVAMFSILIDNPNAAGKFSSPDWLDWFGGQDSIREECRKLFEGLVDDERKGLESFVHGKRNDILPLVRKALVTKGLLQKNGNDYEVFSPLFKKYLLTK